MLQSLRPCAMRISRRRKSWMRWLSLMRSGDPTAPYDREGQYHGPGAHDAQIFTNNAAALGNELSRDVSHAPAIQQASLSQAIEQQAAQTHETAQGFGMGM